MDNLFDLSASPIEVISSGHGVLAPYVYVVDSGNDRIQAFDYQGNFKFEWGTTGSGVGEFSSPYAILSDGSQLFVTDSGNDRVQVFDFYGNYIGEFGVSGVDDGELFNPLGLGVDSGFIYVVDNGNHRIQIFDKDYNVVVIIGGPDAGSGTNEFNSPTDLWEDEYYIHVYDSGNSRTVSYRKGVIMDYGYGIFELPDDVIMVDGILSVPPPMTETFLMKGSLAEPVRGIMFLEGNVVNPNIVKGILPLRGGVKEPFVLFMLSGEVISTDLNDAIKGTISNRVKVQKPYGAVT